MTLETLLQNGAFAAYAYSYPHKTAYRPLAAPVRLRAAWQGERSEALFLYVHLPFCEMRCGFCNLFTRIERDEEVHRVYLDALERQMRVVADELTPSQVARLAIGGGTPTILAPRELNRLFDALAALWCANPANIPASVETSPATATPDRLQILRERGVSRLSMGVQSFIEAESRALGRPQKPAELNAALDAIRAADFPVFNLDLIYGVEGQTCQSWLHSLRAAVQWAPAEIYLYPLYVRPLTGLGKRGECASVSQLDLYRAGRDFLLEHGYQQVSLRMFSRHANNDGPRYCCQEDGMVGLGAGARSYTRELHYSSEYAVGASGVRSIIENYQTRSDAEFAVADYGYQLSADEQKRRYLIQSLLQRDGLNFAAYRDYFGGDAREDWPQLDELQALDLAQRDGETLKLTPDGMEKSDVIGPWLASREVREQMEGFALQ